MIKNITLLLLLFFIIPLKMLAQKDTISSKKETTSIPDIEKVYLHTDRNYYTIGESIWYKAYMVYAYTNLLFDNSKILYVELISPESKIISRNVTQLEGGLGHGDFILSDSIGVKPGTYQLRAYTNLMQNYGDTFFLKKEIQIVAHDKTADISASKENTNALSSKDKKTDTDKKADSLIVNFFPEGGSLIENVSSNLAFKATDSNGNPIEIRGIIFDSNGKKISLLKSSHDGMGKCTIVPEKDQNYCAEITTPDNKQIKVTVPKAEKNGYVLNMNIVDGKKIVSVKTNQETLNQNPNRILTLLCTTRGVSYFEGSQTLNQTNYSFILPEENFPEGIAQITLYDDELKPQSERLIYIEKNKTVAVSITADKVQYKPKEKVSIKISAKDTQENPLLANFSMAATDTNGLENNHETGIDICSYFLMASDIKGKIINPGYYFDLANQYRLPHLDLLLLTQGWRDFIWKKNQKTKEIPDFKVEKEINITGKVEQLLGTKAKENSQVRLVLINEKNSIMLHETTDTEGKFKFGNLFFKGNATMLLNTQNEKGKNRGKFILDSIYSQPYEIDFKSFGFVDSEKNKIEQLKENIYNRNRFFNIPEENQLENVTITAPKKEKDTGPSRFGTADYTYVPTEKGPHFSTMLQLIQFSIPSVMVTGNSFRFTRFNGPPLILIDGAEMDMNLLTSINTDDVAKIEVIKTAGASLFGSRGGNGILLVYTKEGEINYNTSKVYHSIMMKINGFQNTRFFYSPEYRNPELKANETPDLRNTLYWNPYIQPDINGNAEISYYNSEASTNVKVTLEGITNNGIPIVVRTNYTIKK